MSLDDKEGASHWQDIQLFSFTRWVNSHVRVRGLHVSNLQHDLRDGIVLINLLEVISGKSLGRWNKHPRINAQKVENLVISLNFVTEQEVKLVNIGAGDIADGNLRCILGLIWTLILRFEISRGAESDGSARDDLLAWVRSKIPEYDIKNFRRDWNDGRAICALVDALKPGTCPGHRDLRPGEKEDNCGKGIRMAQDYLGVAPLVTAREMANPRVDEKAMMAYIAQFRNVKLEDQDAVNARNTRAHGPGLLSNNLAGVSTHFYVDVRSSQAVGRLEVRIQGPDGKHLPGQGSQGGAASGQGCSVTEIADRPGVVNQRFRVEYTPETPGVHRITVQLAGFHVPGSEFQVLVRESESLGGEGMIRVFFSTTSSSQKGRSDFFSLQRLFEAKKIHLRKDFEPWIAVDLMEKDDREAVFRKAGTRKLPIVFVDDEYRGDYDRMKELEEAGLLDGALAMGKKHDLVSEQEHQARMRRAAAGGKVEEAKEQERNATAGGGEAGVEGKAAAPPVKQEKQERKMSAVPPRVQRIPSSGGAGRIRRRRDDQTPAAGGKAKEEEEGEKKGGVECPRCAVIAKPGKKFCFECGTKLPAAGADGRGPNPGPAPETELCKGCSEPVHAMFCGSCGTKRSTPLRV